MSFDVQPADFLYLDLFPAVVDTADGSNLGDELRIIVTENRVYVLEDTPDGPAMLLQEPLRVFLGDNKTGYTIETMANKYYAFRAPNCGCGASLRGIRLFPDATYIKPTT